MEQGMQAKALPIWFWIAAVLGLAWNLFGVAQYLGSVRATEGSLMAAGMTAGQAAVMLGYPAWMTAAFAIGVFGGTLGCALLLLRKRASAPVFLLSLLAYVALFIGDWIEGVFAALGMPQVVVLSMVVLIAAALYVLARYFAAKQALV